MPELILGVDGGGTKTEALLAKVDEQGNPQILGTAITGPGNVAHNQTIALKNIQSAITESFRDAAIEPRRVDTLVLALAGAGKTLVRDRVRQLALDVDWASQTRVIPDPLAVIAAGSRDVHGIALICGTGSIALAHTQDGETARAGGLGVDDPGSGYWIGVETIFRITERKLQPATLARLRKRIDGIVVDWPDPHLDKAKARLQGDAQRRTIASIAQDVFDLAADDPVIAAIIGQAADELIQLVRQVEADLVNYQPLPLFLAGGVFAHQPEFAEKVTTALGRDEVRVIQRPVLGAMNYALRHSQP